MNAFSSVASAWKPGWLTRAFARFDRPDARFTDEEILTVIRAGEGLRVVDVCAAADIPVETFYTWKARYGGLTLEALREQRRSERRKVTTKKFAVTILLAGLAVGVAALVSTLSKPAPIESAATPLAPPRANEASAPVGVDGTKPAVPGNTSVTPDSNAAALNPAGDVRPAAPLMPPPSAVDSKPGAASGIPSKPGPTSATPGAKPSPPAGGAGAKPAPPPAAATTNPAAPATTAAAAPKPTPSTAARPTQTHGNAPDIVTSAPEGISVQVAALPDLDEARMTVTKLKNAGYPAYMMLTVVNQNELYRVRVGPLKSRELAQIMVQRLERDGYAAPWITSTSR